MDETLTEQTNIDEVSPEDSPVAFPAGLTESALNTLCTNRMNDFEQYIRPFIGKAEDSWKLVECKDVEGQIPNAPVVPTAHSQFETTKANLMRAIMGKPKVVEAKPKFYTPNNEKTQTVEDYLNQELLFNKNSRPTVSSVIGNSLAEAIGIVKAVWDKREVIEFRDTVSPIPDETGNYPVIGEEVVSVTRGSFGFEEKDLELCGWEPKSSDIRKSPWFYEIHYYSASELKRMEQDGKITGIQAILEMPQEKEKGDTTSGKTWKVIEWWGECDWENDGKQECGNYRWLMVKDKCIAFAPNPLSPQRIPYIGVPYQLNGKGAIGNSVFTPIRALSVHTTNQMAKKRSVIDVIVSQPTFYEPQSGLDIDRLKGNIGGYFPVKDSSKINKPVADSAPIAALREDIAANISLMNAATPANEQFQGVGGDEGTATEANINYQSGGVRFGEIVETMTSYLMAGLGEECLLMSRQFAEPGDLWVSESSINGETRMLTKDDLNGDYEIIAVGATSEANRRADIKGKLELMNGIAEYQMKNPNAFVNEKGEPLVFNMAAFLTKEAMPAAGIKNGQAYLSPRPPMPQMPIPNGTPDGSMPPVELPKTENGMAGLPEQVPQ